MAIYLGSHPNTPVGMNQIIEMKSYVEPPDGTDISDIDVGMTREQFEELQDAVGYRTGDYMERTVSEMIDELNQDYYEARHYSIMPNYKKQKWVRPDEWPNLDSLNLQMEGDDFIYMTYDNTKGRAAIAWHIEKVSNGKNIEVTMGHINNGNYVVDETIAGTSNNYVRWLTDDDADYPVVRITGDIRVCYSYGVTANGATQAFRKQPVLERIAYVPHLIHLGNSYTTQAWGVFTLQREKIGNGDGSALTRLYYGWAYCRELEELDISELKTPNITSLSTTFIQCIKLRELDLRAFSVNKVTNCSSTFSNCRNLKTIDIRNWNTSSVTTMANMFDTCLSLEEIKGIEDLSASKVTNMSALFSNCRTLRKLDLSNWDVTNKLTNLNSAFNNCYSLIELNLSNWDVSGVTTCSSTFNACGSLKRLNLNGWKTSELTSIYNLFAGCHSIEKIDLSPFTVTNKCASICYLFSNCWALKEINFPEWDVSGISNDNNNGHSVFNNCYSLEKITGISNWKFQFTNSLQTMFQNCYSLKELDVSGWTVNNCTNLSSCFLNCASLQSLDLSNWNPENCTTFASIFNGCNSLTTVGDISDWDTTACTNMSQMFRYCYSLEEFPSIQNWDLSNVTSLDSIFSECYSLEHIGWNNVNIPKCTNTNQLFRYCYNLKSIRTENWTLASNISYSASYYQIYGDCWNLRDIDGIIIPSTYPQLGFGMDENLSHESLLKILNTVPQVTGTHTLHLTTMNINTLTTDEKKIATDKGWTLAN